jgi:RNA polymerase sigma-70 factor (ECF subfamily)
MKLPSGFNEEDRLAAGLIGRMAARDTDALDELYRLYHRPLLSLFSAVLKDAFAAEEVLQDTFVRSYREAHRYDPEAGNPFAWLATIGKRMAIDRLRKRRARPNLTPDKREQPGDPADKDLGNVDSKVHDSLEFRWIQECLQGLSGSQREMIELAFLEGYTHHEISNKLQKPLGTVKSDLRRGLMRLRKAYLEGND